VSKLYLRGVCFFFFFFFFFWNVQNADEIKNDKLLIRKTKNKVI